MTQFDWSGVFAVIGLGTAIACFTLAIAYAGGDPRDTDRKAFLWMTVMFVICMISLALAAGLS